MWSDHFRFSSLALALLTLFTVLAGAADAAELVMFRRDGCPYCAAWDREIGLIYPKTDAGKRVPLRVVDLGHVGDASIHTRSPVRYTPTFVLMQNGEEIGRIEGYPGDAFFWGLLDGLIERLTADSAKDSTTNSSVSSALMRGEGGSRVRAPPPSGTPSRRSRDCRQACNSRRWCRMRIRRASS